MHKPLNWKGHSCSAASDGQDVTGVEFLLTAGCDLDPSFTCTVVILPGSCPTDVNRDGDTGINDFLSLLGAWGPCP